MSRTVLRAVVLVAALLAVGACRSGGESERERNSAEAAAVQAALADLPGVVEADVDWLRDASTPPTVDVDLLLEPGADAAAIVETASGEVWRSSLSPLDVLDLEAYDPAEPAAGVVRTLVVADERGDLERRFGARPTSGRIDG